MPTGQGQPAQWLQAPVWQGEEPAQAHGPDIRHSDFDLLPNWYELYIGTDPYNPDTDGDMITDRDELLVTHTNPLKKDTDENGWTDYEDWMGHSEPTSDPDKDGLTNEEEIKYGTGSPSG